MILAALLAGSCLHCPKGERSMTGDPNAFRDQLVCAVMVCLALIGQNKAILDWGALAMGHCHLTWGAPSVTLDL